MRLINLNLWGGKIYDPLLDFIKKNKNETNIFSFQEAYKSPKNTWTHVYRSDILGEISTLLPDFNYYFYPMISGWDADGKVDFPISIGQVIFVRKDIEIMDSGYEFVYLKEDQMGAVLTNGKAVFPRNYIYTKLKKDNKEFLVINLHGFWEPAPKYDTPQRLRQSEMILDFINKSNLPTILAGDFNLSINTRSLLMLEDKLDNLVKKFNLQTTRSSLYDPYYAAHDKFADYIFTTPEIKVKEFKSLPDEVSDHLPLMLDFEV